MRLIYQPILFIVVLIVASCNGAENKADGATEQTTINKEEKSSKENIQQDMPSVSAPTSGAVPEDSIGAKPDNNEILARIDQYLVSKPEFQANASVISNVSVPEMGGISPATAMAFVAPEAGVHTPVGRIAQDHAETAIWGGTLSTICADDVKSPVLVTCTVNVIC